ncbi:hypothetical protein S40293_10442 [Stachybotrys chartarum IBT 40293]|nr:hypothetical protein S40293_10442 [Stachybotrys chartarum IBT 40293]
MRGKVIRRFARPEHCAPAALCPCSCSSLLSASASTNAPRATGLVAGGLCVRWALAEERSGHGVVSGATRAAAAGRSPSPSARDADGGFTGTAAGRGQGRSLDSVGEERGRAMVDGAAETQSKTSIGSTDDGWYLGCGINATKSTTCRHTFDFP